MFGRDRLIRDRLRDRFVVTLTDGGAFSGVLLDADPTTAVFADVRLITEQGEQPAQGEVYIERLNIAYMQRIV